MEKKHYDVVIAGGGMAGVCAALASARQGVRTALIQDRSVLGGNSSSEMRVWTVGATAMGRNRYAAETGIVGELDLLSLYRNPEGNPHIWDSILLDLCTSQPGLTLYLNTVVLQVTRTGTRLDTLRAYRMNTETWFEFSADFFIDCTGDGSVGALAGITAMRGRESQQQFGESLAPEEADAFTLGNTLLLYSRSAGKKVTFRPPSFAYDIDHIHNLIVGNEKPLSLHTSGCDFWWLETGGNSDTVADGDTIRFELQRLVFGIWNYIKNSGRFDADDLELEWVGSLPAKRESRRLTGAYVLTQNDILAHRDFEDAVACGGWPIDTHPPGGIYSKKEACEQRDAGVYQIPLRCLYAAEADNLFFAGRNISASHLAFASTRVMKTCAVVGQAAGTAAALCKARGCLPSQLSGEDITRLQRQLLWDDQWIPNEAVLHRCAPNAPTNIRASGHSPFENTALSALHPLDKGLWVQMPPLPQGSSVSFWLKGDTPYEIHLLQGNQRHACVDMELLESITLQPREEAGWVTIPPGHPLHPDKDLFLHFPESPWQIGISRCPVCGCVGSVGKRTGLTLVNPCFRTTGAPDFFAPEEVANIHDRTTCTPNLWVSQELGTDPVWLECTPAAGAREVQFRFDPELNRDYNQLKPDYYGNGWDQMPMNLVRDFRVLAQSGSQWKELAWVRDNHRRCCTLPLSGDETRLRLEIQSTWGAPKASVYAVWFR